jgi:IS30 family transposase
LGKKYSLRDIAKVLGRSVSTLSDEIKRNSVNGEYNPKKAQHKSYVRRRDSSFRGKKIVADDQLRKFIDDALVNGQSAKAIAGRLKYQEKNLPNVSKDTIYRYTKSPYGKLIGVELQKKRRFRPTKKVTQLKDRVFINERPKNINNRSRIGDLEGDFIVSGKLGKGILLVVTDRRLRVAFLELILSVSIDEVHSAFGKIKERFPEMRTLTLDNDILFQMHKTLEQLLQIKIYFCNPFHSWEKGSVENTNKQIRKFIPKGSDLSRYDQEFIEAIEETLNQRFMECLKYATPEERLNNYRKNKKQPDKSAVLNIQSVRIDPVP